MRRQHDQRLVFFNLMAIIRKQIPHQRNFTKSWNAIDVFGVRALDQSRQELDSPSFNRTSSSVFFWPITG